MKKIIAAIDGLKYPKSTTEYAIMFSRKMGAHLVGVFLDDFSYHSYKIYELVHNEEGVSQEKMDLFDEQDKTKRHQASACFEAACREAHIEYTIHHDRNTAIHELLHESIYADLLVIAAEETLTHYEENPPTHFMRDLLTQAECPVLVVPQEFSEIKKLTLLYDGEPSSVYAVKMFSYLLPDMLELETEIVSVKEAKESLHVPDNRLMKEFMNRRFPESTYTVLKGLPEDEIINHLKNGERRGELVVLGAYGRSATSRWFRSSLADHLMKGLQLPLFITHNK